MSSLTEALTSAKKEIESQGIRLRDLEALLNEERRAREDAEERANRLERESIKEPEEPEPSFANGDIHKSEAIEPEQEEMTGLENGSTSPGSAENTTTRLQQRLELMVSEMNEMKQQMEQYRERAETAEADRKSLAEMIETIRTDNAKTANKEARRRSRSDSQLVREVTNAAMDGSENDEEAEEGEITIIREKDIDEDGTDGQLRRASVQNGQPSEMNGTKQSFKSSNALVTRHPDHNLMYHGGPVGAIVAVVALGVAVMAMLNQYPKGER